MTFGQKGSLYMQKYIKLATVVQQYKWLLGLPLSLIIRIQPQIETSLYESNLSYIL